MKVTRASSAVLDFYVDDEQEESGEDFVASSASSSLSFILETQEQGSEQQSRWELRKRKVVLYDQEMIDGDTSMEGLVDENMWLSKKRNIKSRKFMRKVRPRGKSASSGNLAANVVAPDPEYIPKRKDHEKKIIEINEATPRRSARCCKLSKKMIQIKEEMREETDHKKDVGHCVEKGNRVTKVKTYNNNIEIIQKTCDGLRRSSRIKKSTKEILNYRKELQDGVYGVEDGDSNVECSGNYLQQSKRKKQNLSRRSREEILGENLDKSSPIISQDMLNSTDLPPPVRRKVFTPPAADVTTITPRQARKLCKMTKTVSPVAEHVPAVQVGRTEELLADSASHDNAVRSPSSHKIKKLLVLTESEEERDDEDDQLFPAALMKPMENPRDWNCFQCVYELSKLDARLTISDLDPLLQKKVDGDALMKSSLSDLVNVVGLEYSPAVRVIFLVQQIQAGDSSGKGGIVC